MKLYRLTPEAQQLLIRGAHMLRVARHLHKAGDSILIDHAISELENPYIDDDVADADFTASSFSKTAYDRFRTVLLNSLENADEKHKAIIKNIIDNFRQLFD